MKPVHFFEEVRNHARDGVPRGSAASAQGQLQDRGAMGQGLAVRKAAGQGGRASGSLCPRLGAVPREAPGLALGPALGLSAGHLCQTHSRPVPTAVPSGPGSVAGPGHRLSPALLTTYGHRGMGPLGEDPVPLPALTAPWSVVL